MRASCSRLLAHPDALRGTPCARACHLRLGDADAALDDGAASDIARRSRRRWPRRWPISAPPARERNTPTFCASAPSGIRDDYRCGARARGGVARARPAGRSAAVGDRAHDVAPARAPADRNPRGGADRSRRRRAGLALYRELLAQGDDAETAARHLVLMHYDPAQDNASLFAALQAFAQRHLRAFGPPLRRRGATRLRRRRAAHRLAVAAFRAKVPSRAS